MPQTKPWTFAGVSNEAKSKSVEFTAKVINPIIIVTFVIIYWVVGLILYYNPAM